MQSNDKGSYDFSQKLAPFVSKWLINGEYKGFTFRETTSGGKAGKGHNKTASIFVYRMGGANGPPKGYGRYFRYQVSTSGEKIQAYIKAKEWVDDIKLEEEGKSNG